MYTPIIGLEIHVELKTKSKMFCGCPAEFFGAKPNTHCCPVCLGMPGALPVPNRKAIEWCVEIGMALNCEIAKFSKFDRKNYFYPDLAKGYQISQYDQPFCVNGFVNIDLPNGVQKKIRIRRVHMEEDTGKLVHAEVDGKKCTLVDFNRSGVPLVEIVTEPDIRSSEEAKIFLKKLHQIIRFLGVSDADMEKGTMRLEPNISLLYSDLEVKDVSEEQLPKYKVEVKNINSFNFAKRAIDFELKRHEEILLKGEFPKQETRGWNEKKQMTVSQRSKEEAQDYRYFPEPDIPPIALSDEYVAQIRSSIPELPDAKKNRYVKDYSLSVYDAGILIDDSFVAEYFEKCVKLKKESIPVKVIANWIINKKADISKVSPEELINIIAQSQSITSITDDELTKIIRKVIEENPKAISDFKSGKESALMFLVGLVMRQVKNPQLIEKIKDILSSLLYK